MCVYVCACVYIDQTPTPTRFLRNVEESGLFQELADNPFDQVQQLYLATVQLPSYKNSKKDTSFWYNNGTSLEKKRTLSLPSLPLPCFMHTQEFEKSKNGADKQTSVGEAAKVPHPSAEPVTVTTGTSTITIAGISMAPPPSVANPDKPVRYSLSLSFWVM